MFGAIGILLAASTPWLHAGTMTEYFQGTITSAYVDGVDPGGVYDASPGSTISGSFSFDLALSSGCTYSSGPNAMECVYTLPVTITLQDASGSAILSGPNLSGVGGGVALIHGISSLVDYVDWVEIFESDNAASGAVRFSLPIGTLTDLMAFPWGTQTPMPIDINHNSGDILTSNPVSSGVYSYGDLNFSVDSVSLAPLSAAPSPEPSTFALISVLLGVISLTRARGGSRRHVFF
jgi:hypothetical protein